MSVSKSSKISSLEVTNNTLVRADNTYFNGTVNSDGIIINSLVVENDLELNELQLEEPSPGSNTVTLQAPILNSGSHNLTLPTDTGSNTQGLTTDGVGNTYWSTLPTGTGDVEGPGSSTNNTITLFADTTGKLIKNSGITIDSSNNITTNGNLQSNTSLILEDPGAGSNTITIQSPTLGTGSYTLTLPTDDGNSDQLLTTDGLGNLSWSTLVVSGDISGPASSTDNAITCFDGTTGKLVKNSSVTIDDNDNTVVSTPNYETLSVSTWTTQTIPSPNVEWTDMVWSPELGIFCVVAGDTHGLVPVQVVMTSPDGINWTSYSTTAVGVWTGISWSPELGLFAACSSYGVSVSGASIMTSPDGINWTTQTTPLENQWNDIEWSPELGLFATCSSTGAGNRIMTSPDGINWTTQTTPVNNNWFKIEWSPELGLFAACSSNGAGNRIMTSPDGINWTTQTTPSDNYNNISWSPGLGLFCAVSQPSVITSPDGINWTSYTTPTSDTFWGGLSWSEELALFVLTGAIYDDSPFLPIFVGEIYISLDGITWTSVLSTPDKFWRPVEWSPQLGLFAVVGTNLDFPAFSPTGIVTSQVYDRLIVAGSIKSNTSFIIEERLAGSNTITIQSPTLATGSYVLTLPDDNGSNSQALITDGSGNLSWGVAAGAAGGSNTEVQFNDNGSLGASSRFSFDNGSNTTTILSNTQITKTPINTVQQAAYTPTWTTSLYLPAPGDLITWSSSLQKFVTVSVNNSAGTSTDFGATWTSSAMDGGFPINKQYRDLLWVEELGLFVTAGSVGTGRVQTSPDGQTWTSHTSSDAFATAWLNMSWSPKLQLLCVVGFNNTTGQAIATSPDGVNWTSQTFPTTTNGLDCVAWSEDLEIFTALAYSENISLTSSDGTNWTSHTMSVSGTRGINDLVWASSLGIFCGAGSDGSPEFGDIVTSPDGINWATYSSTDPLQVNTRKIVWSPELELFCTAGYGGTPGGVINISSDGQNWIDIPYPNSGFNENNVRTLVWVPDLQNFYVLGTGPNAAIVKSNSDFSNFDFQVDIGTTVLDHGTTVSIEGQNINIGVATPNITIGYQNTQVNIQGFIKDPRISGNTFINNGNLTINNGDINVPNISTGVGNPLAIDTNGQIVDTVSLRAYKKNEVTIENESGYDLDSVLKLQPKFFTWKETLVRDLGFVAEETEEACTAFTNKDNKGNSKNINDRSVLAALIALIKRQSERKEALKDAIKSLKGFLNY